MALQKSQTQDIQTIVGNGLAIYQDGTTGLLMLKDTNGKVVPLQDFFQGDQDNIGRVFELDEASSGTERKSSIASTLNEAELVKQPTDAEQWVTIGQLTEFAISDLGYDGCGLLPEPMDFIVAYHNGANALPVVGDQIFLDSSGTLPLIAPQESAKVTQSDPQFIATDISGFMVEIECVGGGR